MKTFQDILKEHPVAVTQNTNTHIGTTADLLCRWYNMWWGTVTDTHMQLMDDGTYIIIGSRIGKGFLDYIRFARILPTAPNTVMPHSFDTLLTANHMHADMVMYNGQPAIGVSPSDEFVGEIQIPMTEPYYRDSNGYACNGPACVASADYM